VGGSGDIGKFLMRKRAGGTKSELRSRSIILLTCVLGVAADAQDNVFNVSVSGKANGDFGFLPGVGSPGEEDSIRNLVEGIALAADQKVWIITTGEIQLFPGFLTTADGAAFLPRSSDPNVFVPLDESFFDAGGDPTTLDDPVPNLGALMGAFVPRNVVESKRFIPRNNDPFRIPGVKVVRGSIGSEALFLIGSGPFPFTPPIPGSLFLGVNDPLTSNNAGAFSVTIISAVQQIDIQPGRDPNSVDPDSNGVVAVAVLGSEDFDAMQSDFSTMRFGPDEASPVHDGHAVGADGDGFMDMVFHFNIRDTGIACGDSYAALIGETFEGKSVSGVDALNPSPACEKVL
jgi:hypothetical protein